MNEFIEQFLIESREYVEQGTADLLALEKSPTDKALLDGAFRAFHTLKGSAGIVDFHAMSDAVHAAEDMLAAIRSGLRGVTTATISDCLSCLDLVGQWLDAMQATGELPEGARAQADAMVRRFGASGGTMPASAGAPGSTSTAPWVDPLRAKHSSVRSEAKTALRYAPDPGAFLEHEDPLGRIAGVPGLLALDVGAATPWPTIEALDPYVCNIVISALTRSSPEEVSAAMRDVLGQCEIVELVDQAVAHGAQAPLAHEVLLAQAELLREMPAEGSYNTIASAGVVAVNVLRSTRRDDDAAGIARSAEASLEARTPEALLSALEALLGHGSSEGEASQPAGAGAVAPRTLRVDTGRIDALVGVTSELIVAKNGIGHLAQLASAGDPRVASFLKQAHARFDTLVTELQRSVLGLRVLPLRHVFQRFPRLLREMGAASGKPAELFIEGEDTEADKAIVEMLFEPLLHVLRNALDHGVEDGATRRARDKPPVASIRLSAERSGDRVVVQVRDDGGGVDVARVRAVAAARRLVEPQALDALDDDEIIDLIFEPGFSTAETVTDLSGRGVGMDAVRTAILRLGGRVGIESESGRGTTVRFTLPFSVMMTRVLVVVASGQAFGIPLDAVVETLRVDSGRIVCVGSAHAIVLRNRTVPVVSLAEALGLPSDGGSAPDATLVVATHIDSLGAIRVDGIGERMEVMLKPLEGLLAGMRGFAGSTLLGDGSVLLILDLGNLIQ